MKYEVSCPACGYFEESDQWIPLTICGEHPKKQLMTPKENPALLEPDKQD